VEFTVHSNNRGRDTIISITTTLRVGYLGYSCSIPDKGNFFFSYPKHPDPPREPQPPVHWAPGALVPVVKWPGTEAHHPPPFTADVMNEWSYVSVVLYAFMVWLRTTLGSAFA